MKEIRPLLVAPLFALSLVAFLAGCSSAKSKPKAETGLAAGTEEGFRQRWIERRGAELVAGGLRVDLARQQALDEFREKYGYLRGAAQK